MHKRSYTLRIWQGIRNTVIGLLLRPQLTFKTIKVNYYKEQERFTNNMTAVQ